MISRFNRTWMVAQFGIWVLLVVGWHTDSRWLFGAAVVLSLLSLVERIDNLTRQRRGGESR